MYQATVTYPAWQWIKDRTLTFKSDESLKDLAFKVADHFDSCGNPFRPMDSVSVGLQSLTDEGLEMFNDLAAEECADLGRQL